MTVTPEDNTNYDADLQFRRYSPFCVYSSAPSGRQKPTPSVRRSSPRPPAVTRLSSRRWRTGSTARTRCSRTSTRQQRPLQGRLHRPRSRDPSRAPATPTSTAGPAASPEKASSIFKKLIWSPKEDFVIFPEEGWAAEPGSSPTRVVALNPGLGWETAEVPVGTIEWLDELSFMNGYHFDCDYGVLRFDGQEGKVYLAQGI